MPASAAARRVRVFLTTASGVGLAQLRAQLGELGDGQPAVVGQQRRGAPVRPSLTSSTTATLSGRGTCPSVCSSARAAAVGSGSVPGTTRIPLAHAQGDEHARHDGGSSAPARDARGRDVSWGRPAATFGPSRGHPAVFGSVRGGSVPARTGVERGSRTRSTRARVRRRRPQRRGHGVARVGEVRRPCAAGRTREPGLAASRRRPAAVVGAVDRCASSDQQQRPRVAGLGLGRSVRVSRSARPGSAGRAAPGGRAASTCSDRASVSAASTT
jgi:hypothetical protein